MLKYWEKVNVLIVITHTDKMNNEKLILEALRNIQHNQLQDYKMIMELKTNIKELDEALNPKEDVPYEKSIELCERCFHVESQHNANGCVSCRTHHHHAYPDGRECNEFVKSSSEEKK